MKSTMLLVTAILTASFVASPNTCFANKKILKAGISKVGRYFFPVQVWHRGKRIVRTDYRNDKTKTQLPDGMQITESLSLDFPGATKITSVRPDGSTQHVLVKPVRGQVKPEVTEVSTTELSPYEKMTVRSERTKAALQSRIASGAKIGAGIAAGLVGVGYAAIKISEFFLAYDAAMKSMIP